MQPRPTAPARVRALFDDIFDGEGGLVDELASAFPSPSASASASASPASCGLVVLDARASRWVAAMDATQASVRLLLEHNDRLEAQLRGNRAAMRGALRHVFAAALQARARAWLGTRRLAAARGGVVAIQTIARRRAAAARFTRRRRAAVAISACWRRRAIVAHTAVGRCLCGKRGLRGDLAAAVLLLESPDLDQGLCFEEHASSDYPDY
ncbi:hypothetical protein M885DRAFT_570201 [Pelagophyceae sp. CCMP2097]|nr:hypothetical protein M885DRAFT_570201 [Pelagophyceae sp. CCMP2097]